MAQGEKVQFAEVTVGWDDVGGLDDVKARLQAGAMLPLRNPESFKRLGIAPAKAFLLYGPPGTGKSLIAQALAKEAGAALINVSGPELLSQIHGNDLDYLASIFVAAKASAPCVIHIDEIDILAPARGTANLAEGQLTIRMANRLIAELDQLTAESRIVVIGSSSRPGLIDPALLRPGRIDEMIYAGTPDTVGREVVLNRLTMHMPLAKDVDLVKIADQCDRFTGADLEDLVRRAGMASLRKHAESVKQVDAADFDDALAESKATITADMEAEYGKMRGELKKQAVAVNTLGFVVPGMLEPVKDRKHG